jgi:hypothetical protein
MTAINRDELALLSTLDQGIVWAVISLHRSNTHPRNFWYDDNASVRQEVAKDLVNWNVQQDPDSTGRFSFTTMMVLRDPNPMQTLTDACQLIKSYSAFALTDQVMDKPVTNKGLPIPGLPIYVTTLEQALYYFVRIAEAVGRLIRYANRAGSLPEPLTGNVCMDFSNPVPALTGIVPILFNPVDSAEGIINQFGDSTPLYEGFTDYVKEIFDGLFSSSNTTGIPTTSEINTAGGYEPIGIETLPVCKEQDPSITNLAPGNLQDILTRP